MSNFQDRSAPSGVRLISGDRSDPAPSNSNTVLSIENVAKMFGVRRLTLRYYEWRGLIERRQRVGRVPVYSWADCERIAFIIKCRRAGVSLDDIVVMIEASDEDVPVEVCKIGQETCMALVDRLEQRRKLLDEALAELTHVYALLSTRVLHGPEPEQRV